MGKYAPDHWKKVGIMGAFSGGVASITGTDATGVAAVTAVVMILLLVSWNIYHGIKTLELSTSRS